MLKLVKAEVSKQYLYPGEEVFITCTFEAMEDYPIDAHCEMFCDLIFGYMTLPDNYAGSYRIKGNLYPQPMHLRKGESVTGTMKWEIPHKSYAGTFKLHVGISDDEAVPYTIMVKDREYKRYPIGDIEVAFGGCAPKFVHSHNQGFSVQFSEPSQVCYEKTTDIEVYVRDLKKDTVICRKVNFENHDFVTPYVSFSLLVNRKDVVSEVILDNVIEAENYELLSVKLPTLINAEKAKIISVNQGGRLIDSTKTFCIGYEKKFQQKNLGILCDGDSFVMLEAPFIDECIHYSVYERNGKRYGAVGVTLTYRIRKYGPYASVKVINKPTCVIMRTKVFTDILYYLRKGLKRPDDFYDRGIFYYFEIECDGHKEKHTFLQALDRVKMLHNMTGGVRQVMLLRGWQHEGHDTGYPDVFTLNKRAGTLEELKYVIEEAKKYNAVITFHDNYDDMYEELPAYDNESVAIDAYNEPYKGWIWVSGLSRIMSLPKYVKSGKMAERVKKTLSMYPVHTSYHLDVLSCEPRRYDLDENVRMAAQEVVEYKKAVVKEYQKYGFHVTSEGVSEPFAGLIGHAWNMGAGIECVYPGEEFFPILGMIFHGILPYSGNAIKMDILSGAEVIPHIEGDPSQYYKAYFYLFTLPMGLLCDEYIDGYVSNGGIHTVTYSNNHTLIYYEDTNEIEVKKGEEYYTKCGNTFVKGFVEDEYLGYTKSGQFEFELPFENQIERILEIDFEGEKEELSFEIKDGMLGIITKPDTAFKVILAK